MKNEPNYKISFAERALKGTKILSQQPEISYQQALKQVQRLKETSQLNESSKNAENY